MRACRTPPERTHNSYLGLGKKHGSTPSGKERTCKQRCSTKTNFVVIPLPLMVLKEKKDGWKGLGGWATWVGQAGTWSCACCGMQELSNKRATAHNSSRSKQTRTWELRYLAQPVKHLQSRHSRPQTRYTCVRQQERKEPPLDALASRFSNDRATCPSSDGI